MWLCTCGPVVIGVGCYLDHTRKYFGTVSQNAGYFSVSVEYIFVVNWLRTLIFWFVSKLTLQNNYYMFFPKMNVWFYFLATLTSVFYKLMVFYMVYVCCAAKTFLTEYDSVSESLYAPLKWKENVTFRLSTLHFSPSNDIPKLHALCQCLFFFQKPSYNLGLCEPQWPVRLWWSG